MKIMVLFAAALCARTLGLAQESRHANAPVVKVAQGGDPAED